jgi:two-component system OmpR family response regulator
MAMAMKLLLIEDDAETAAYIIEGLGQNGHVVDHAADGREGMLIAAPGGYDVVIVDRRLPTMDGLQVVKVLRGAGVKTPVLFLTTMAGVDARVEGLEQGGDDYLVKPFSFSELVARINALARRPPLATQETLLRAGTLRMDLLNQKVTRGDREINLQPVEFRLLEYLLRNAGRVVTKTMLLERVWSFHFDPKTNVVETNISRLRGKIDKPFGKPFLLRTVHGVGYLIDAPD